MGGLVPRDVTGILYGANMAIYLYAAPPGESRWRPGRGKNVSTSDDKGNAGRADRNARMGRCRAVRVIPSRDRCAADLFEMSCLRRRSMEERGGFGILVLLRAGIGHGSCSGSQPNLNSLWRELHPREVL